MYQVNDNFIFDRDLILSLKAKQRLILNQEKAAYKVKLNGIFSRKFWFKVFFLILGQIIGSITCINLIF